VALPAALLMVVLGAGPAAAGGPSSVLLVAGDHARTASSYVGRETYNQLNVLLGNIDPFSESSKQSGPGDSGWGPYITATWLVRDIQVWRVDKILYAAPGGPWIATQFSADYPDLGKQAGAGPDYFGPGASLDTPVLWHTSRDRHALMRLLNRLDLTEDRAQQPVPATGPTTAAPTRDTSATQPTGTAGPSGWWWTAGVLLLGAGIGFAATRFRGTRSPSEPAQQLIDREL
jgi:hypothetical protein